MFKFKVQHVCLSACDSTGRPWGSKLCQPQVRTPRLSGGSTWSWATHARHQDTWPGGTAAPLSERAAGQALGTPAASEPRLLAPAGGPVPAPAAAGGSVPGAFAGGPATCCSGLTCVCPSRPHPNSSPVEDPTPTASERGAFWKPRLCGCNQCRRHDQGGPRSRLTGVLVKREVWTRRQTRRGDDRKMRGEGHCPRTKEGGLGPMPLAASEGTRPRHWGLRLPASRAAGEYTSAVLSRLSVVLCYGGHGKLIRSWNPPTMWCGQYGRLPQFPRCG